MTTKIEKGIDLFQTVFIFQMISFWNNANICLKDFVNHQIRAEFKAL